MNKKEFEKYLNDKLCFLVDNVRVQEVSKYIDVINNYTNMGQTEENAVASFGNVDDLVMAIYLSHGLDYKKLAGGKLSGKGIKIAFVNFFNLISGKDKKLARSSLFYFIYIILLCILLKIVFIMVRDLGAQILGGSLGSGLADKIYGTTFDVLYVIAAIVLFFKLFTKRFAK